MKKIILLVLTAAGVLFLSGCGVQNSGSKSYSSASPSAGPNATSSDTTVTATSTPTEANVIGIQNFAFSPATLTVKKGTTVTWTNNDSAVHTVKSDVFASGNLAKGESFSFTFDTAGTFSYSCGVHPSMKGTIIVQ